MINAELLKIQKIEDIKQTQTANSKTIHVEKKTKGMVTLKLKSIILKGL